MPVEPPPTRHFCGACYDLWKGDRVSERHSAYPADSFLTLTCSALTNYLHEFHIHSFVSAKYWGKGSKLWTGGMVSALTLEFTDATRPFL